MPSSRSHKRKFATTPLLTAKSVPLIKNQNYFFFKSPTPNDVQN